MRIEMLNGSMNGRAIGLVAACGMMGSFAGEASAQEVPVLDENSVLFVARIPGTPNYGTFAMQIDPVNGAVTPPELFPGDIFRPGPQANPSRVPFAFPDSIYLRKRPGRTKYTSVTLASRSIVGVNIDIEKGVEFVFERSMPDLMNSFINGGGADVLPEEFLSGELLFPGEMHTPVLLESREDIQNDIDGWGDAEFRIGSGGGGGGRIAIVAWKELDKASPALASAFIGPTVAEGGPAFADLIGGSPTTPQTAALLGITPRSTKYLDKSSPAIFHGVTGPDGPTFGSLPLPAFAGPVDEVVSGSQGVYMYEAPTEAGDLGTLWLLDLNGERRDQRDL